MEATPSIALDKAAAPVEPGANAKAPRRSVDKDHLPEQAGRLALVDGTISDVVATDPLVFWTAHTTQPHLTDLTEFAMGRVQDDARLGGAFHGRRALIEQLAPAFQARYAMASPRTIKTVKTGLRKWWRLFDALEAEEQLVMPTGTLAKRVTSVLDLSPLHGSRAVQSGMSKNDFHSFVVLADITRLALGQKRPLYWPSPAKRSRKLAIVPLAEDIKAVYHGIKADWHAALDRWALGDGLIAGPAQGGFSAGQSPDAIYLRDDMLGAAAAGRDDQAASSRERMDRRCAREHILAEGLGLWVTAAAHKGHVDIVRDDLVEAAGQRPVHDKSLNISEVVEAIFPNGADIRSAFHLCLAVGGLNASVLTQLRLDLSEGLEMPADLIGPRADDAQRRQWVLRRCPFLVPSPIDGEYYIEGWKERAKAWISRTYKWKQHLTPGPILVELIIRTWPLRVALARRLDAARSALGKAIEDGVVLTTLNGQKQRVHELEDAVRSVWLYRGMHGITWLDDDNYHAFQPSQTYLQSVIRRLNEHRQSQGRAPMAPMEPRRFRDAYAAWALDYSGGEVLAVMIALDHRRMSTTATYLENTAVRARVGKKYRTFTLALFGSMAAGDLDPTRLAMETRHAGQDAEERARMAARLVEYRAAVKSRYGVGCRNPHRPSALADPAFEADGVRSCSSHRCTLCPDNAIITPDAFPGLMLRQAELEIREECMPVASFSLSSFDAELQNVRSALTPLKSADPQRLLSTVENYKREIRAGQRRVPGFSIELR